eukprot:36952-Pelagomonas_calceolata.AAC.2
MGCVYYSTGSLSGLIGPYAYTLPLLRSATLDHHVQMAGWVQKKYDCTLLVGKNNVHMQGQHPPNKCAPGHFSMTEQPKSLTVDD